MRCTLGIFFGGGGVKALFSTCVCSTNMLYLSVSVWTGGLLFFWLDLFLFAT